MKKKYILGFDSLRFLAIIAIILYHYYEHIVMGGYLGVNIFLILSGYLVTSQLERKYQEGQQPQILKALFRRFQKIFRPLLVFVVISLIFLFLFRDQLLVNVRPTVLSSLLMVNNWQQIFSGQSYFEAAMNPSIFTHLWYLSAYFQMNVIWNILYPAIRPFFKQKENQLFSIMVILAALSALAMGLLYDPAGDPSRVYYGTDTRLFSFLLGAAAALLPQLPLVQNSRQRLNSLIVDGSFVLALAGMTYLIFQLDAQWTLTYRGGMLLFDILASYVIFLLAEHASMMTKLFTFKPMVWLGQQTFSIYLFYYPIYIICYAHAQNQSFLSRQPLLQILLIFALSILFEGFIVKKEWTLSINNQNPTEHPVLTSIKDWNWPVITKVVLLVSALLIFLKAPTSDQMAEVEEKNKEFQAMIEERNQKLSASDSSSQDAKSFEDYFDDLSEDQKMYYDQVSKKAAKFAYNTPTTFIGDSIVVGATPGIYTLYPQATISANVGQQLKNSLPLIENLKANNQLQDHVVVFLGSNGAFTQQQLNDFIAAIGDRDIYLVTSHVNQSWIPGVNQMLAEKANEDENDKIHLVHWSEYFSSNPEAGSWLAEDGIHFQSQGMSQWLGFVTDSIYEINQ